MKRKVGYVFDGMRAEYDFDYSKGVRGKASPRSGRRRPAA